MYKPLTSAEMYELIDKAHKGLKLNRATKTLIPQNTENERQNTSKNLNILKESIEMERLQRRRRRIKADWFNDRKLAVITSNIPKLLDSFGRRENNELILHPEEALFLLETNRLELLWNNVPFSIEQAYCVLLTSPSDLMKYRTFQELVKNNYKIRMNNNKRRNSDHEPVSVKKLKVSISPEENKTPSNWKEWKEMKEIETKNIEEEEEESSELNSDPTLYQVYNPNSKITIDTNPDYRILTSSSSSELPIQIKSNNKTTTMHSINDGACVHFYELHQIDF